MISSLQISGMLDYGKDCFRRICKAIKINKSCYNIMVTDRQIFLAATNAFTMVNDCWQSVILSAVF